MTDARDARLDPSPLAYAAAVAVIAVVTLLGLAVFSYASLADITMLYLIAIAIASLSGRGPALAASSVAVAAFDFCFVPPRFTFTVSDPSHLLTFGVMFGAGLAISTLTGRLRRQEREAVIRERDTAALLAFTRDIAAAATPGDIAAATVRHLEEVFPIAASVVVLDPREPGALVSAAGLLPLASQEQAAVRWAIEHREPAGLGTETLPGAHVLAVPLVAGDVAVGALAVAAREDPRPRAGAALPLLDAFAQQAALALDRVRAAEEAREAALRARTEALRSSLLSAVSHDLRTPLAVITGAATTLLRADEDRLPAAARADLLASIVDDARRLERVLGNLLQLTRVESGLVPSREWIPVEELVGAALTRLEEALGDRAVVLDVPPDVIAAVDPVLFEQVLINLIENALKHGAPPIELGARREGVAIVLEVRDHGAGIPARIEARLFDRFVRASTAPGAGLGLAVVRAIVEAHGGKVTADAPPGGGARFRIELPAEPALAGAAPPVEPPLGDTLAALPVRGRA
jgi:two-component system sensor histidine kinase KdpD